MILSDLCDLYDLKRQSDPDAMPERHWCRRSVGYELVISRDGEVLACYPLLDGTGEHPQRLMVPMAYISKTSGIVAGFLCDGAEYVFGAGTSGRRDAMRQKHEELAHRVLDGVDDDGARAYLCMLERYPSGTLPSCCEHTLRDDVKTNMVFRLDGDQTRLHDRSAIHDAWNAYAEALEGESEPVTCLVSGKVAPKATLFPQVTGLFGAQSAGASLVSCNADAFSSYGQRISTVGSISAEAAEKAGDALSYVLKDRDHHVRMGGDYLCFWTDSTEQEVGDWMSLFFDSDHVGADNAAIVQRGESENVRAAVQAALERLAKGEPIATIPDDATYYVADIAPYQARLAIRFYETGSLGDLQHHVAQFLRDTQMENVRLHSLYGYLLQTAVLQDPKNLPRTLVTSCMRALIRGTAFPRELLQQVVLRTRVDHASKNDWDLGMRAAILRACLIRNDRQTMERSLTVSLNENNDNQGYLLGRLFALLDKAQRDANGGSRVGAGIRERYMGAASTTPARVFPQLLRLAQHHISKSDRGPYIDGLIQGVIAQMSDAGFPRTLSYDDQGEFYIGYYQQTQALYRKKGQDKAESDGEDA